MITELVLNHTSDQHPWFQTSRKAEPGSDARNFYVWSNSPDKYREARIIFKDFESSNWAWDPVGQGYFWHRFYAHQPDLNFDNARTQKTMLEVVAYWLKMGVDGLRLDAVPYLYEREGTNCENLVETHDFLKRLRAYIDASFKNRMLLAEANQWPTDAAAYFGQGDECHMSFHFPLMPRMFMAIQMEDRFPIVDIFDQTPPIPENSPVGALPQESRRADPRDGDGRGARLHVQGLREGQAGEDKPRDPKRLAPLLDNDRKKIELINVLLFTMPGTPVIYYGDEIGMGDNYYLGDRNGVRTPMQWSADSNAGFSKTNPQKLYLPVIIEPKYHYETVNVENQESDPSSLLVWMKRLIFIRKHFRAFGSGSMEFLYPDNWKILVYVRKWGDEILLIAVSLSRHSQAVDLDLSKYEGYLPQDVFGGIAFPQIGKSSYRLTFTSYGYYIFSLTKCADNPDSERMMKRTIPELTSARRMGELFKGKSKDRLEEEVFPSFLSAARWFAGKARPIERMRLRDVVTLEPIEESAEPYYIVIIDIYYSDGLPEAYLLPIGYAPVEKSAEIMEKESVAVLARVILEKNQRGVVFDAIYDPEFRKSLLRLALKKETATGSLGEIAGGPMSQPTEVEQTDITSLSSRLLGAEQSNTSIVFEDRFILKLFRRVEEGLNPEVEIGDYLTKQSL